MPRKGEYGVNTGPRPHIWISGPDPIEHKKYIAWQRHRAQANFRNEPYELTWADWRDLWQDHWHLRGRSRNSCLMIRRDHRLPWSRDNCQVVTRAEFGQHQAQFRRGRLL